MVLDGFGLSDNPEYNAVEMANTPVIDKLKAECPFVKGFASGLAVGLPDGQNAVPVREYAPQRA